MSIENNIKNLTDAINRLTETLQGGIIPNENEKTAQKHELPESEKKPKKQKPVKEAEKQPAKQSDTHDEISAEDVRLSAIALRKAVSKDAVLDVLSSFGANVIKDLDPADYADVVAALDNLTKEAI